MLRLVPTPIGNIADISLRAIEALSEADILLCEDTRVTKKLINLLKERYQISFKQNQHFISLHSHNEKEFISKLDINFFDKEVVYVSDAGMPGISDPGALLIQYCMQHSIEYDVLPGANALLSAFVASGYSYEKMLFLGFLPHKGREREASLNQALNKNCSASYKGFPYRIEKLLKEIEKIQSDRELFLAKELTKKFQTYFKGYPQEILQKVKENPKGEWVVVLSPKKEKQEISVISQKDIESLDIPKKQKAKLISKITGKSIKSIYQTLI